MQARDNRARGDQAWPIIVIASIAALLAYTSWVVFGRPDPSPADLPSSLFLIAPTPFSLAGRLLLAPPPTDRIDRQVLALDLGIGLASSFVVWWYFVLSPQAASGPSELSPLIPIASPVADAVLLTILIGRRRHGCHLLHCFGIRWFNITSTATTIADALFVF